MLALKAKTFVYNYDTIIMATKWPTIPVPKYKHRLTKYTIGVPSLNACDFAYCAIPVAVAVITTC